MGRRVGGLADRARRTITGGNCQMNPQMWGIDFCYSRDRRARLLQPESVAALTDLSMTHVFHVPTRGSNHLRCGLWIGSENRKLEACATLK